MIFERLEYMVNEKTNDHEAQFELIKSIKQLYFKKLESLKQQCFLSTQDPHDANNSSG